MNTLMKLLMIVSLGILSFQVYDVSIIRWGYSGVHRGHLNVSPDGSLNLQSKMDGVRSAFEIRPTLGLPSQAPEATTELVLYGDDDMSGDWSRMNWSAMSNSGGHYRFGVEGPTPRNVLFAFENMSQGDPAHIPLQFVAPDSVPFSITENARVAIDCNPLPAESSGMWLIIRHTTGFVLRRVEQGPPNSSGAGYRSLRVLN